MKIKLLQSRAGINFSQNVDDEIDVDDDEAKRMIEAGQAVPVRSKQPEKAVRSKKSEKATK